MNSRQEMADPALSQCAAAERVVAALCDRGVEYIFGVPGDTSLALYDALRNRSNAIRHIVARDERAAAIMADVYARLAGKPGVCEAPSGAGALYLAPGVAEANASSIPVLGLTTDVPLSQVGRNVLTEMDQAGLFGPITKWQTTLQCGARAGELVDKALRIATSGRCGAVQITLPEDVLEDTGDSRPYGMRNIRPSTYPAFRTAPDPAVIGEAAALLSCAERPLIIAGGGVRISEAWQELTRLAELCAAPVGTSINDKGSIDELHPLSIGVIGGNGARPYANSLVERSDLILFVGCKTDSVTTLKWTLPSASVDGVRVIQLDVDPNELGNGCRIDLGIAADARLAILALIDALGRHTSGATRIRPPWANFAEMRQKWHESVFYASVSSTDRLTPVRVFDCLRNSIPRESVLIADAGTPTPYTAALYPSPAGRYVVIPRGYGGLGYAIPGVAAAKLARPNVPVIGLMGDGSFGMAAGGLEVIARLELPITMLHFNNASFGWIRALQHFYRDDRFFGVDFSPDTDYVGIARGFGIHGVRAESPKQLEEAMRTSIRDRKSVFIDMVVASEDCETPPVHGWQASGEGG